MFNWGVGPVFNSSPSLFQVDYNWMFYLGVGPVFFSFFAVGLLSHYDNSDPVLMVIKKALQWICRRRFFTRLGGAY